MKSARQTHSEKQAAKESNYPLALMQYLLPAMLKRRVGVFSLLKDMASLK